MVSPVSLIITAFARVSDVRGALTPELRRDVASELLLVDLGGEQQRLGGSVLAQVFSGFGSAAPDLDSPELLEGFVGALNELKQKGSILAYHDRSDGGLFAAACEMAFAGRVGLDARNSTSLGGSPLGALFNEELGALLQVRADAVSEAVATFERHGLGALRAARRAPALRRSRGRDERRARSSTRSRASRCAGSGRRRRTGCSRSATTASARGRSTSATATPRIPDFRRS